MKLKLTFLLLFIFICNLSQATHIIAGEITYEYLGKSTNGELRYKVGVHLLRECSNESARFGNEINLGVYYSSFARRSVKVAPLVKAEMLDYSCGVSSIKNTFCTEYGLYETILVLDDQNHDYILAYDLCCRNSSENIEADSDGLPYQGIAITAVIPSGITNSVSRTRFIRVIPHNTDSHWDPFEQDLEGDSIVYENVKTLQGEIPYIIDTDPPLHLSHKAVTYKNGYTFTKPLGADSRYKIVDNKVDISARNKFGQHDLAFIAKEYRDGKLISTRHIESAVIVVDVPRGTNFNLPYDLNASKHQLKNTLLEWKNCANQVTDYAVYRKKVGDDLFTKVGTTGGAFRSYVDSSIEFTEAYVYYVEGIWKNDTIGVSNEATLAWNKLGISPGDNLDFAVYPNPVRKSIHVKSHQQLKSISIINMLGVEVYAKQQNLNFIDVQDLSTGVYYLILNTSEGEIRKKFLKH